MSTFWNIKKVFTQWDNNAQEKAKEIFLNCFICADGYIIHPICTQWVYLGKRYLHNITENVLPKERSKHRPSGIPSL